MKLALVEQDNSLQVFSKLYPRKLKEGSRYAVGDRVRISKNKSHFEKGNEKRLTGSSSSSKFIFHEIPVYELASQTEGVITGRFHEPKLSLVRNFADKKHQIGKVLELWGGKFLVCWLGYGK